MSRSRRKTPIFGNTKAESEAQDKAIWHRRHRRVERSALKFSSVDYIGNTHHAHSDTWSMDKDGRHWWSGATPSAMRK